MNFAFGEVEGKGRGTQSTKKDAGPLKGEGHSWRAGLPAWPSIILLKGKYAVSRKKEKEGGEKRGKKLKTSQLIIILMASLGFRTSQVREDKFHPLFLSSGAQVSRGVCASMSPVPTFLPSFSLFFFYEAS